MADFLDAGGHHEAADLIGKPPRRHEIGQRDIGRPSRLVSCWRRVCKVARSAVRLSSAKRRMSSPDALAGQKPITALGVNQFPAMTFQHRLRVLKSWRAAGALGVVSRISG